MNNHIETNPLNQKTNKHGLIVIPPDAYLLHDYLCTFGVGVDNSVKAVALQDHFGWSPRYIRVLRSIINSPYTSFQRKIIGGNKGYYVPNEQECDDAYEEYEHRLWSQAMALLVQVSDLRKHHKRNGQTRLKMSEYAKEIIEIAKHIEREEQ